MLYTKHSLYMDTKKLITYTHTFFPLPMYYVHYTLYIIYMFYIWIDDEHAFFMPFLPIIILLAYNSFIYRTDTHILHSFVMKHFLDFFFIFFFFIYTYILYIQNVDSAMFSLIHTHTHILCFHFFFIPSLNLLKCTICYIEFCVKSTTQAICCAVQVSLCKYIPHT